MDLTWLRPVAVQVAKAMHSAVGLEIDDLVQAGAVAAVEAAENFDADHGATLKTWQWKQAEWAMRDLLILSARRHRIAPIYSVGLRVLDEFFETADAAPGPEAQCLMSECRQALADLAGSHRQLLTMLYTHDFTRAAAAREIGGDRWTIRAAEKAALSALRKRLTIGEPA